MKISKAGLDLIYSFEGKHRALGDGRYISYRCPAGIWTVYAGCTHGVTEGMIVTEQEGETMFRAELDKFEKAVDRLVTAEINQHQRDALISFAYNVGEGALAKSSLLRLVNAKDFEGASRAFAPWNKARNGGPDKPLVVMPGLVRRRAAEAALFLRPVEPLPAPDQPQAVEFGTPAEVHAETHAELNASSMGYSLIGRGMQFLRWGGIGTAAGAAGKKALEGGDATAVNIAPQATDLLGQVNAAAHMVAKFGLPFLLIAIMFLVGTLILAVALEEVRARWRKRFMGAQA